jgi:hypothetical protein
MKREKRRIRGRSNFIIISRFSFFMIRARKELSTRDMSESMMIVETRDCDGAVQSKLSLLFTEQWREIFETHIALKLKKRSEIKFLSMAFKDARDAVERSKIKVGESFNISEFTSISQMELAWDNYRWGENGYEGTQELFCERVARMNKLEYLVWAREVKNCDWNSWTIYEAVEQGNLAMVKYCVENGCPMYEYACTVAAEEGHLDVLKYLHENDCPWSSHACRCAHENNHVDCLNYLIEQKAPDWERYV